MQVKERKMVDSAEYPQKWEKITIQQETRLFHSKQLDIQACVRTLTSVIHILHQGEKFTKEESTNLFFACTKQFQSNDIFLRRMTYLVMQEIVGEVSKDDSLIAISCQSKDMVSKKAFFRINSIRVQGQIIDTTTLPVIERYLKQSFIDTNPHVVIASLVSAFRIIKKNPILARSWQPTIVPQITSTIQIAQQYAQQLTYLTCNSDILALQKSIVHYCQRQNLPNAILALTQQVRIVSKIVQKEMKPHNEYIHFLHDMLHHHTVCVSLEAANGLLYIKNIDESTVQMIVDTLIAILPSNNITTYAILRRILLCAQKYPKTLYQYTHILEQFINSNITSISSLVIVILLQVGSETSLDRLLSSLQNVLTDSSEEFKILLLQALRSQVSQYPNKHAGVLSDLLTILRDPGSLELKQAAIQCIFSIIDTGISSSVTYGLDILCEYIEDCDFSLLNVAVQQKQAIVAPNTPSPAKYVRCIYNRVIQDTTYVRAAAICAQAHIAASVPSLKSSILVLLKRCTLDVNEETRSRAFMYIEILQDYKYIYLQQNLKNEYQTDTMSLDTKIFKDPMLLYKKKDIMISPIPSLNVLEYSQRMYISTNTIPYIFTSENLQPYIEDDTVNTSNTFEKLSSSSLEISSKKLNTDIIPKEIKTKTQDSIIKYCEQFDTSYVNEIQNKNNLIDTLDINKLWSITSKEYLTEKYSNEYIVTLKKYIFIDGYILCEFNIKNVLINYILENVTILTKMDTNIKNFTIVYTSPSINVESNDENNYYILLNTNIIDIDTITEYYNQSNLLNSNNKAICFQIFCQLQFSLIEQKEQQQRQQLQQDIETFTQNPIYFYINDFINKPISYIGTEIFKKNWQNIPSSNEIQKKFTIQIRSLREVEKSINPTVEYVLQMLDTYIHMSTCEPLQDISSNINHVSLNLIGKLPPNNDIFVRLGFTISDDLRYVTFKLGIRCENTKALNLIGACIDRLIES